MKRKLTMGLIMTLTIGVIIGAIYISSKGNEKDNIYSNKETSTIDMVISQDIRNLEENEIEDIKNNCESILDSSSNNDELIKANYILAFIKIMDSENKDAIIYLEKARKLFDKNTERKLKIWINYTLAEAYLYEERYEESDERFNEAIHICETGYNKETLIDLYRKGASNKLRFPDGFSKSIELAEKALELSKSINYEVVESYWKASVVHAVSGNNIQSIEYQLAAIDLAKEKGSTDLEMKNRVELAINYLDLENYEEAIKYLKESLAYTSGNEGKDAYYKSYALVNLIESYIKIGNLEEATNSIGDLEEIITKIEGKRMKEDTVILMYLLKSKINLKNRNLIEAKRLLDISAKRYEENINNFRYVDFDIYLLDTYGDIYYDELQYDKALEYHKASEALAKERGTSYYESQHAEKIYIDYEALKDYENANIYMKKYIEVKDNIRKKQDNQYTQYLHKKFEDEKNKEKITILENNKNKLQLIVLGLGAISIVIVVMSVKIQKKNREINKLNTLFKKLSVTDGLTGIPNRRALDEYLAGNWALYRETKMPISFAMIDIDFFKKYNDNYGHPEGDKSLEIVSKEIKKTCKSTDFVARYGGEEFVVIMLNTDKRDAMDGANKIRNNIENLNIKHEFSDVSDRITITIGISTAYIGSTKDYEDYIKKADRALYEAKKAGRNRCLYID